MLRLDLKDTINISTLHSPPTVCPSTLSEFKLLIANAIEDLNKKSKTKSCTSDPVPTSILKLCTDKLRKNIATIVNNSLKQAIFPESLKQAIIIPSLKKDSLDVNELSNYRPIANLPFLSKIVEKVIVSQLE